MQPRQLAARRWKRASPPLQPLQSPPARDGDGGSDADGIGGGGDGAAHGVAASLAAESVARAEAWAAAWAVQARRYVWWWFVACIAKLGFFPHVTRY